MYLCYLITNNVNGKKYVGITKTTIGHRWSQHKYVAKRKRDAERKLKTEDN